MNYNNYPNKKLFHDGVTIDEDLNTSGDFGGEREG
jgi:hypothetical protein